MPLSKRAERRGRYLQVALELFARHGFVGTTTDMIVAEVGGSKATLYKYFPSKDALVAGLMDQVSEHIAQGSPALAETTPLAEALTRYGESTLQAVISERAVILLRLCLGEYGRFPELARVIWEHGPAITYARFRHFLAQRIACGEIIPCDTQLAAEHFLAGLVGHIQLKVAMGQTPPLSEAEIQQRVAACVATFLARYANV